MASWTVKIADLWFRFFSSLRVQSIYQLIWSKSLSCIHKSCFTISRLVGNQVLIQNPKEAGTEVFIQEAHSFIQTPAEVQPEYTATGRLWEPAGKLTHMHTPTHTGIQKHITFFRKQQSHKKANKHTEQVGKRCTSRDTFFRSHLVSRFLSTLGCWLGLQLLSVFGWSPLDLG